MNKTAAELVANWEHGDEQHREWLRRVAIPDIEAALAELHDDPNRLPLELIPARWRFEAVVAGRGIYIAELWSNDYRRSVSSDGETPRIAVLNAIESVPK